MIISFQFLGFNQVVFPVEQVTDILTAVLAKFVWAVKCSTEVSKANRYETK